MSSFSPIQAASQQAVVSILTQAPVEIDRLHTAYSQHFPSGSSLSSLRVQYAAFAAGGRNVALEEALAVTADAVDMTLNTMSSVERFIHLCIPKMEDGNNFGVTIQLQALKHINDAQEKLQKQLDEVMKYSSSRADAVEKCKLASASSTTTTTKTDVTSNGTDKEKGETANSSTSQTVEQKKVESSHSGMDLAFRQDAVAAVDLMYYSKAKNLFSLALTSLLSTLDFVEKNRDKIEAPKGKGSSSAYSSMY